MDGERDTEIAIGCYQTDQNINSNNDDNNITRTIIGDIRAFRMSLWYEHTGLANNTFQEPQSLECVEKMRSIGDQMWNIYKGEEVVDMEGGHLVTYPMSVTQDGKIEDLLDGGDYSHFPDTNTPVKGKRSKVLPPIFTT